jgi:hypothetical protein
LAFCSPESFEAFGVLEIRKPCVLIFCPKEQATSFFLKLTNEFGVERLNLTGCLFYFGEKDCSARLLFRYKTELTIIERFSNEIKVNS